MSNAKKSSQPSIKAADLIHGDESQDRMEVSPSISVSTTFRAPHPRENFNLANFDPRNPPRHIYSRWTQETSTRAEKILSKINDGYALTYSSGLTSTFAALTYYQPKRIAIGGGYHGVHGTFSVYKRFKTADFQVIGLDDEYQEGDICWLETPLNPIGESRDIQYYADKIHAVGGHLVVDSTFAPPPLQYPFKWGADMVMHSGTKYFGGHSDLLCGILVTKSLDVWTKLFDDRTYLGSMMGSLEAWLLLRSLRTMHLRVPRQSETATALAQWLYKISQVPRGQKSDEGIPGGLFENVWHSSIQAQTAKWDIAKQMEGGWNATFALQMKEVAHARILPHLLKYFVPATSLGGVESLIEQRSNSDAGADPRIVRISVGVEDFEDLKSDMTQALKRVVQESAKL